MLAKSKTKPKIVKRILQRPNTLSAHAATTEEDNESVNQIDDNIMFGLTLQDDDDDDEGNRENYMDDEDHVNGLTAIQQETVDDLESNHIYGYTEDPNIDEENIVFRNNNFYAYIVTVNYGDQDNIMSRNYNFYANVNTVNYGNEENTVSSSNNFYAFVITVNYGEPIPDPDENFTGNASDVRSLILTSSQNGAHQNTSSNVNGQDAAHALDVDLTDADLNTSLHNNMLISVNEHVSNESRAESNEWILRKLTYRMIQSLQRNKNIICKIKMFRRRNCYQHDGINININDKSDLDNHFWDGGYMNNQHMRQISQIDVCKDKIRNHIRSTIWPQCNITPVEHIHIHIVKAIMDMLPFPAQLKTKISMEAQATITSFLMPNDWAPTLVGQYAIKRNRYPTSIHDKFSLHPFLARDANGTKLYLQHENDINVLETNHINDVAITNIEIYDNIGEVHGMNRTCHNILSGGCVSRYVACHCCSGINPNNEIAIIQICHIPQHNARFICSNYQSVHESIHYHNFIPFASETKINTWINTQDGCLKVKNTTYFNPDPYNWYDDDLGSMPDLIDPDSGEIVHHTAHDQLFELEKIYLRALHKRLDEMPEELSNDNEYYLSEAAMDEESTMFDEISQHISLIDIEESETMVFENIPYDDQSLPDMDVQSWIGSDHDDDSLSVISVAQTDAFIDQGILARRFPSGRLRLSPTDTDSLVPATSIFNNRIAQDDDELDRIPPRRRPRLIYAYMTVLAFATTRTPDGRLRYITEGPIYALIDTGAQVSLIKQQYIMHNAFKDVCPPRRETTVTGISSNADPLKVTHEGFHEVIGKCLFGDFSCNLIGIPQLLRSGFELHAVQDTMSIIRSSNKAVIYIGRRNHNGLYECDINVTAQILEAFNAQVNLDPN